MPATMRTHGNTSTTMAATLLPARHSRATRLSLRVSRGDTSRRIGGDLLGDEGCEGRPGSCLERRSQLFCDCLAASSQGTGAHVIRRTAVGMAGLDEKTAPAITVTTASATDRNFSPPTLIVA